MGKINNINLDPEFKRIQIDFVIQLMIKLKKGFLSHPKDEISKKEIEEYIDLNIEKMIKLKGEIK